MIYRLFFPEDFTVPELLEADFGREDLHAVENARLGIQRNHNEPCLGMLLLIAQYR